MDGSIIQYEASNPFNIDIFVRPTLTLNPMLNISSTSIKEVIYTSIVMTPSGSNVWAHSHALTVGVTNYDTTKPLHYAWSLDVDKPIAEGDWLTLANGTNIISPDDITGEYYFHVRGTAENSSTVFHVISQMFNIDYAPPK